MKNDNKTFADIIADMRQRAAVALRQDADAMIHHNAVGGMLSALSYEAEAAHKRELAKKDDEIATLVNIINTKCNKCGDCAKFGKDCTAGDIFGAEDNMACDRFVSKDVAELRECLKEAIGCADEFQKFFETHPYLCKYTRDIVKKSRKALEGAKDEIK